MKFVKAKPPKPLAIAGRKVVLRDGCAVLELGFNTVVGPREAVKLARWLTQYARWSSLRAEKGSAK